MKKYLLHNKWLTTIIALPSLLLALFLVPSMWSAWSPPEDAETYFNAIVKWLSKAANPESKLELLEVYCETMNSDVIREWYIDKTSNWIYYSSKNSLFVQVLCKWVNKTNTFYKPELIKWTTRDKILGNAVKWCEWDTFEDCNFADLLPALFNATMNDHSTLSVAWWAMKEGKEGLETSIQEFSKTYFSDLGLQCWKEDSQYISKKSAAADKDALCSHPSTYQSLKNTIEALQQQQKNLYIIEWNDFWSNIKCDDKVDTSKDTKKYDNLFECAYTNSTSKEAWGYHYNMRYNELLYYKLLISWLTNDKLKDPNIKPLNLTKDIYVDLSDEIQNLKREEILSENAIQIMQKTINNIRATFPLHVWLQAYYEDTVTFRKSLVKIYTPIHQLNYKLRNIQVKK